MIRDASLSTTPPPEALRPAAQPAAAPCPAPGREQPAAPVPNPRLRIDASLNLVVVEFRDAEGATHSIPSAREIEAYRTGQAEPPGGGAPRIDVTR